MDPQNLVIIVAIVLALAMAVKPVWFIPNPNHRSRRMERSIRYIGMSVAIVLTAWFVVTLVHMR